MQPNPGIPFDIGILIDEDESDPLTLQMLYADLDPADPLLDQVDSVMANPAEDGLESLHDTSQERGGALDPALLNWRMLAPDDPRGQVIQSRISDGILKKVDHLISKTRGELWANRSDVVREAIFHYVRSVVHSLQMEDPTLLSIMAEADLNGRAAFHGKRRKRLEEAVDSVRDYLTDLVNLDDHEEAHRFIRETAVRIREIRVSSWRRHWLLALNALPIMRVTARLLDSNGWDIPIEFYPAAGKTAPSITTPVSAITAPPLPGGNP